MGHLTDPGEARVVACLRRKVCVLRFAHEVDWRLSESEHEKSV
jgi:hypothetical protein